MGPYSRFAARVPGAANGEAAADLQVKFCRRAKEARPIGQTSPPRA